MIANTNSKADEGRRVNTRVIQAGMSGCVWTMAVRRLSDAGPWPEDVVNDADAWGTC